MRETIRSAVAGVVRPLDFCSPTGATSKRQRKAISRILIYYSGGSHTEHGSYSA